MANVYGMSQRGFGDYGKVPTDFTAEQERIAQQQRLADILSAQGMKGNAGGMVGNVYVKPSITQGLSQMLNAYMGGKMRADAATQQGELGQQKGAMLADIMQRAGQPTQTTETPLPQGEMGPGAPMTTGPNYAELTGEAMRLDPSYAPLVQGQQRAAEHKTEMVETRAARDAAERRADETKRFLQEGLIASRESEGEKARKAQADRDRERAADHENALRIAASLRQPPQPPQPRAAVAVQDPNDPTQSIFVPAGQEVGKRPAKGTAGAADKPLTESQGKAALFQSQMIGASKNLDAMEAQGFDPSGIKGQGQLAMAGGVTNILAPAVAQQYKQGQEQWAEAYLRLKTGAATNRDEITRNIKTFFPVIGDRPEVIAQKQRARREAEMDVGIAAGPGNQVQRQSASGKIQGASGGGGSSGLTPAEQAELDALRKKHGR